MSKFRFTSSHVSSQVPPECFSYNTSSSFKVQRKICIYRGNRNGLYTFSIHHSSYNTSNFFQVKRKSASTAVTGTVYAHFVYTVPLTTRVTFFKVKGKSASTAVTGTVYAHFVCIGSYNISNFFQRRGKIGTYGWVFT